MMMMNSNHHHASSVYDSMANVTYSPEYNPQSIMNYYSCGVQVGRCSNPYVKNLMEKAKNHLSAIGWTFFYVQKKGTKELRYQAPNRRVYITLRSACECAIKNQDLSKKPNLDSFDQTGASKIGGFKRKYESFSSFDHVGSPKIGVSKEPVKKSESFSCEDRPQKKIKIRFKNVASLYLDQKSGKDTSVVESEVKNERFSCNRPMKQLQDVKRLMVTGKKVVARKAKVSSTKKPGILGLLIENNIVERGSRVSYLSRKDGRVMATGQVYEDGIQCECCDEMFLLTKFEEHAGSTNHRPAANLFFDDKRSILDCQAQLRQLESVLPEDDKSTKLVDDQSTKSVVTDVKSTKSRKSVVTDVKSTKSSDCVMGTNDEFCSFCNKGGELLLCDSCTSSFHSTCIGLDCVPVSDVWFCPACACQICHQGQPSNLTKEGDGNAHDLIKCAQCELHFHISCNKGFEVCADDAKWFCTSNCKRIYVGLMEIRGKVNRLKGGNLSWSLLKYDENDIDYYESIKTYSKLMKALDLMHKYFKPVKHSLSDKDMIEDVIFSRANFEGFYTAILANNDEILTVVTLRVHGCKVAEIPFVATSWKYRRLGLCRLLMNEVERMIRRLGVDRIVLPAMSSKEKVKEKVSIWIRSFGFHEMKDIERLDLVQCKFLEFLGTKTCVKRLQRM